MNFDRHASHSNQLFSNSLRTRRHNIPCADKMVLSAVEVSPCVRGFRGWMDHAQGRGRHTNYRRVCVGVDEETYVKSHFVIIIVIIITIYIPQFTSSANYPYRCLFLFYWFTLPWFTLVSAGYFHHHPTALFTCCVCGRFAICMCVCKSERERERGG